MLPIWRKALPFTKICSASRLLRNGIAQKQAFIGADGIVLGLMEMPSYDYRTYTMAHLAFPCGKSEFPNVVTKVQGHGLEIVSGPQKSNVVVKQSCFVTPSGNILEVCYPSIAEWKASSNLTLHSSGTVAIAPAP